MKKTDILTNITVAITAFVFAISQDQSLGFALGCMCAAAIALNITTSGTRDRAKGLKQ